MNGINCNKVYNLELTINNVDKKYNIDNISKDDASTLLEILENDQFKRDVNSYNNYKNLDWLNSGNLSTYFPSIHELTKNTSTDDILSKNTNTEHLLELLKNILSKNDHRNYFYFKGSTYTSRVSILIKALKNIVEDKSYNVSGSGRGFLGFNKRIYNVNIVEKPIKSDFKPEIKSYNECEILQNKKLTFNFNPKNESNDLKHLFTKLLLSDKKFGSLQKNGIEVITDIYSYVNPNDPNYNEINQITRDDDIREQIKKLASNPKFGPDYIKKELDEFLLTDDINNNHVKETADFSVITLSRGVYFDPGKIISKIGNINNYIIKTDSASQFIIKYNSFFIMYDSKPGNGNQKFHVYYQNINEFVPIIRFEKSIYLNDFNLYHILPNIVVDDINESLFDQTVYCRHHIKEHTKLDDLINLLTRKKNILEFMSIKNEMYANTELEVSDLKTYKDRLTEQIGQILDIKFDLKEDLEKDFLSDLVTKFV